jgi:hypothetical protein
MFRSRRDTFRRRRYGPAAIFGVVAVAAWAVPMSMSAQSRSLGPLTSEDGAPLHRTSLNATTSSADPLQRGETLWGVWLAYANIFEQDSTHSHVLMVDMERLISATQVTVGLLEGLEVGGRLTFETTGPGVMDGVVSWWHERIGAGNANRERFPEGEYDQRLQNQDGSVLFDAPRRTLALDDVRLFGKVRLVGSDEGSGALSTRATTRIPVAHDPRIQERAEVGISLLGRLSGDHWHAHAMIGANTVRARSRVEEGVFRRGAYHWMLGAERSLGPELAGMVQYHVNSPVLRTFEHREVDGNSYNLTFGLLGRVGRTWRWEVSFQEDLPPDTPAADFTLGLRVSRAW